MNNKLYDLAVIGGGPAGYRAAERAGQNNLSCILFEKNKLGGVCLNEGCIPTKTLLYTAKLYEQAKYGDKYGIIAPETAYDFEKIQKRKDRIVKKLVGGVGASMKKHNVEVINEYALIEERKGNIISISAGNEMYQAKNLLIATGSVPAIPLIRGIEKVKYYTNKEILTIESVPEKLTILGGGAVGTEFAGFFSSMGTQVTVIELMDEIMPEVDEELSRMIRTELEKKGVNFYLSSNVTEIKSNTLFFTRNNKSETLSFDSLLISTGRKPVLSGFGMEKSGVEYNEKGIHIDNRCRTNLPNVYAAGDVTGFSLLAHTAYREADVAINNILGKKDIMRYDAIPWVVYTSPEIASVGLTEVQAQKKGIPFQIRKLPMAYSGRFVAENEGRNGLAKIIVGEKYNEILGVHLIGNPASEIIYGAGLMIELELKVQDVEEIIFPHPTVSEIIRETVFAFRDI